MAYPSLVTQIQAAMIAGQDVQAAILSNIYNVSSGFLTTIPILDVESGTYQYTREINQGGGTFRGINEDYTAAPPQFDQKVLQCKPFGGKLTIDKYLIPNNPNGNMVRAQYETSKSKGVMADLVKWIFKGDSTSNPKQFDGFNLQLLGTAQTIYAGTAMVGANLKTSMISNLLDQCSSPENAVLVCGRAVKEEIFKCYLGTGLVQIGMTEWGMKPILFGNNPIFVLDEDSQGNAILDMLEGPDGTGTGTCGSLYAINWELINDCFMIQRNPFEVLDEGLSGTSYSTLLEWPCALVIPRKRSAARLCGITAIAAL